MFRKGIPVIIFIIFLCSVLGENKYSRNANEKKKKSDVDFRTLEKPFRMNKLNILWTKAQHRLTEPKLKSLYSDLMIHDKEEITLKRVKSEGGDKEGLREAELRRKLTNIMASYNLREHFDDHKPMKDKEHAAHNSVLDEHINKSLFKDKKLNALWAKAETSGFSAEELQALKQEFQHHQDKIDQYYDLLETVDDPNADKEKEAYINALDQEEMERYNDIKYQLEEDNPDKDLSNKANLIRDKHRSLRDGLDRLHRIAAKGPNSKEFIEPKVQGLWKMAAASNFTVEELSSLKVELQHYESRLLKLRHLHIDHVSNKEKYRSKVAAAGDKMDHFDEQQQMIKKHTRKVEKMHADLEGRILQRHSEL